MTHPTAHRAQLVYLHEVAVANEKLAGELFTQASTTTDYALGGRLIDAMMVTQFTTRAARSALLDHDAAQRQADRTPDWLDAIDAEQRWCDKMNARLDALDAQSTTQHTTESEAS